MATQVSSLLNQITKPTVSNPGNFTAKTTGPGILAGTQIQPGYQVPIDPAKNYSIGGKTYNQFGDLVTAPATAPAQAPFDIQKYIADAMASIRPPAPVYAPKYDIAAAGVQARAAAEANVNPYYTGKMQEFIQRQVAEKANTEKQTQMNIQNIADQAKQIQDANAVTGTRTTEDAASKQADINQAADWRQTDQAGQYDMNRVAEAIDQAKSGTTGSGLAAGQSAKSRESFNTTESRQATGDQQKRDLIELGKARTFEDLATSNTNATTTKEKGTEQAKFDLSRFVQAQDNARTDQQENLNKLQKEQLLAEEGYQKQKLFSKYLENISNPEQYLAAMNTYGRLI